MWAVSSKIPAMEALELAGDRVFITGCKNPVCPYIIEEKGTEQDEGYDQGDGNGDEGAQGGDVYRVASVHICFFPSLSVFHLYNLSPIFARKN